MVFRLWAEAKALEKQGEAALRSSNAAHDNPLCQKRR